jgi:nicotinamide mononucleotide (NMN) deamidase PncC
MMETMLGMTLNEVQAAVPIPPPANRCSARCAPPTGCDGRDASERTFQGFLAAMGRPDLEQDPRFAQYVDRRLNWGELMDVAEAWSAGLDSNACLAALDANGVPCSHYRTVAQAMADPQIEHRGALAEIHDAGGTFRMVNPPFRMSSGSTDASGGVLRSLVNTRAGAARPVSTTSRPWAQASRTATRQSVKFEDLLPLAARGPCVERVARRWWASPGRRPDLGRTAYCLSVSVVPGWAVVYTRRARRGLVDIPDEAMAGIRSASEPYALLLAGQVRERMRASWGLAETGASGPTGNSYGDAAGHSCLAVSGPVTRVITIETASSDRVDNMMVFTARALQLLDEAPSGGDGRSGRHAARGESSLRVPIVTRAGVNHHSARTRSSPECQFGLRFGKASGLR